MENQFPCSWDSNPVHWWWHTVRIVYVIVSKKANCFVASSYIISSHISKIYIFNYVQYLFIHVVKKMCLMLRVSVFVSIFVLGGNFIARISDD